MASKKTIITGLASLLALFGLQAYAASTTVSVNFGSTRSSMPAHGLGVGCSVYDWGMTGSGSAPAVTNAGDMAIRYPGGSFADIYHWQTGTACNGGYVGPGTGFDTFMNNLVNRAGAKAIITCNYGSDPTCSTGASPSEAAAWVQYANVTKGYGIKYWEIGNEQAGNGYYGSSFSWEEDLHADKSPMAYGRNVAAFSTAMKAFDSAIKIGVSVVTPGSWPDTDGSHPYNKCVLTNCASAVDFVIIHWYPDGTSAQSLQSPSRIAAIVSNMKSELNSYVGARASLVEILITETGPGTNTGPAAALYTSDTYLTWIENGIQNVDFQELHQGFLAESISGVADNTPIWGAYGCRMARNLASVGDTFVTASSGTTMVGVHAVRKTNGHYGVMLINRDPTNSYTITVNVSGAALASSGTRYNFGQANFGSSPYPSSGPTQSTITGIGLSSFSITIPAYSMSVVDIPAANVPPVAPSSLVATASNTAVSLSWNGSGGADSYIVRRSTTSGSGYIPIATGVTSTSYLDTGLVNGMTYYYVVAATNSYGASSDSAEAAATPMFMIKFTGTVIGSSGSWGNLGNTIINVFDGDTNTFYDAVNGTGDWAGLDLGNGTNGVVMQIKFCPRSGFSARMVGGQFQGANVADFSSSVVTLLTVAAAPTDGVMTVKTVSNTNNFRYLRYLGPAGGYGNVAEVEFWGLNAGVVPSAPMGLNATAGDAQVALSWNVSSGATNYYVKRSNVSSNFTTIATNLTLTFTNTGLSNGTLYYFVVSALNGAGESTNSTPVSARPTSSASVAMNTANAAGQLQISWPADHMGWQLQSQTNNLTSGLGTNWVNLPGSDQTNQLTVPLNSTNGSVFFRLVRPY